MQRWPVSEAVASASDSLTGAQCSSARDLGGGDREGPAALPIEEHFFPTGLNPKKVVGCEQMGTSPLSGTLHHSDDFPHRVLLESVL